MITIEQLVELLAGYHPHPWARNRAITLNWLTWFIERQFAICVSHDLAETSGLLLVRPVMNITDGLWNYRFDPEGPVLFVDFIYAADNESFRGLVIAGVKRFGRRETLAFEARGKLRWLPLAKFIGRVLKEKEEVYHGRTT